MDYYKDYFIKSLNELEAKLSSDDQLKQNFKICGEFASLGKIKVVTGHLDINNENLINLGELRQVKSDFWLNNAASKLKTLCKLEYIGGNMSVRYSNISNLGNLKRVEGDINLRDTPIADLGKLEYVGGNLHLPKRLEGINLDSLEIKGKVRFWNDVKDSKIESLKQIIDWDFDEYFSDLHSKEIEQKRRHLTGEYLVKRCFNLSQYNQYIIDYLNDFILFVDNYLESFYQEKYSFYHVLFGELKTIQQINKEFPTFKVDKRQDRTKRFKLLKDLSNEYIRNKKNEPVLRKYLELIKKFRSNSNWNGNKSNIWLRYDEHILGFSEYSGKFEWDSYKGENIFSDCFIYYVEDKLLEIFSTIIDILQNEFRLSRGLPKIGEGWIGETNLYYQIKEKFSNYNVVQHGGPSWLGKQHLDIWIPELNIAIEYHGLQHDQPDDFFGGQDAYDKNVERDNRKKVLCMENGVRLIEVREGYDIQEIIREISTH